MKFYEFGSIGYHQWIAWYDDDTILCLDFSEGKFDIYNVLDVSDFEEIKIIPTKFSSNISKLFIKCLFTFGFDGGDDSEL